jgi:hypothetical protein
MSVRPRPDPHQTRERRGKPPRRKTREGKRDRTEENDHSLNCSLRQLDRNYGLALPFLGSGKGSRKRAKAFVSLILRNPLPLKRRFSRGSAKNLVSRGCPYTDPLLIILWERLGWKPTMLLAVMGREYLSPFVVPEDPHEESLSSLYLGHCLPQNSWLTVLNPKTEAKAKRKHSRASVPLAAERYFRSCGSWSIGGLGDPLEALGIKIGPKGFF